MDHRRQALIALSLAAAAFVVAATAFAGDGASVTGTIRDAKGKPVAGAAVSVESGATTKTDADGTWSVAGVAPGDVLVTAQIVGRFRVQTRMRLAAGEARKWDASIGRPGEISGHLVDEYGHPLTGIDGREVLRCWHVRGIPEPEWMRATLHADEWGTYTDKSGAFSVWLTPGVLFRISVGGPLTYSRAVLTEPMSGGLCDLTIRVVPANMPHARMHCRLEGPDGAVLRQEMRTGSWIALVRSEGDESGPVTFDAPANEWISAPLSPGTYLPFVLHPPSDQYEFPPFVVKDAADVDLGTLRLPPRGRAHIAMTRAGAGSDGVPDVCVRRFLSFEDGGERWRKPWALVTAPKVEGDAPVDVDLAPGRYAALVHDPRFDDLIEEVEVPFEIVSGKTTDVAVPLRGAPLRKIRVRYPGLRPELVMVVATGADGLVEGRATVTGEADALIRLVPGRHALGVWTSDLRRFAATIDIPEQDAPDVFDIVLR